MSAEQSGAVADDVGAPEPGVDAVSTRPKGSLQWPVAVALTSLVVFAGLVAAGVFDPMLAAL